MTVVLVAMSSLSVFLLTFGLSQAVAAPAMRRLKKLKSSSGKPIRPNWPFSVLTAVAPKSIIKLANWIVSGMPASRKTAQKEMLGRAFEQNPPSEQDYVAAKLMTAVLVAFLAIALTITSKITGAACILGFCLGYRLPDIWISGRISQTRQQVERCLPTMMDMLLVCVSSGMNLLQSLRTLIEFEGASWHYRYKDIVRNVEVGMPLEKALQEFARKTGSTEVQLFVQALLQGQILGVPLVETLKEQARSARIHQRQLLEAKINGIPTKLTLCTVFLLMPGLVILTILPNLIEFIKGW